MNGLLSATGFNLKLLLRGLSSGGYTFLCLLLLPLESKKRKLSKAIRSFKAIINNSNS